MREHMVREFRRGCGNYWNVARATEGRKGRGGRAADNETRKVVDWYKRRA